MLVTNINGCGAPGDAPFYGLCSLGSGRFALRGYTQGRYRDHYATVEVSDIFGAEMLLAAGAGLRYH